MTKEQGTEERSHGLVSLATMEARIAEAVAAEREACAAIAVRLGSISSIRAQQQFAKVIAEKIRERAK